MLEATRVTFSGVEVLSAMSCSALYMPTPSRPSRAKRFLWAHRPLPGHSTQPASGNSRAPASTQRAKLKVMGGMAPCIMRPTTALPAHSSGGIRSRAMVDGVRRAGADMPALYPYGHALRWRGADGLPHWRHGGFVAACGSFQKEGDSHDPDQPRRAHPRQRRPRTARDRTAERV